MVEMMKYTIPHFERTHTVKVVQLEGEEWIITYDCPMYHKFGFACRHMYALLGCYPWVTDAHVCWHVGYDHHYGLDPDVIAEYIILRDQCKLVGPISIANKAMACILSHELGRGDHHRNI